MAAFSTTNNFCSFSDHFLCVLHTLLRQQRLHFHNSHHLRGMCLPAQALFSLSLIDKTRLLFSLCSDPFSMEEETEAQGESRLPRWQGFALHFVFLTSRPPGCDNMEVWGSRVALLPGSSDCLPGHYILYVCGEPIPTPKPNVVPDRTLWSSCVL